MKELLKKNLDALGWNENAVSPPGAGDLKVEISESKNGLPVPSVSAEGRKVSLHSRVDPLREARRFTEDISHDGMDMVIVMGFAFGYHCQELADRVGPDTSVVIIEKSRALFLEAVSHRDFSGLFSDSRVIFLLDPDDEKLSSLFMGKASRKVTFVNHRGSFQVYGDYYTNIAGIIRAGLSTKDVNIATLAKFEKAWGSNIARNIRTVLDSPGAGIFFGRFEGVPAIVAAAGPSLTKSLEFLRENRDRAIIVAVDTSYKILTDNGIVPHFCLAVDPQLINSRYLEGTGETETVLVADPTVHPSVFRFFRGTVVLTSVAFDLMKWVEPAGPARGELAHGGSVSTNAYDFAKRTGASPVVMVGQDLSFTSGLAHARGSYLDEQIHNRTSRLNNCQMFNRRQLSSLPPVYVDGVKGGRVMTNQKLSIFQQWFERRNDESLINATAEGVLLKGARNVPHENLKFDDPGFSISSRIKGVLGNSQSSVKGKDSRIGLRKRIKGMTDEIEELIPVLEKSSHLAGRLSEMIKRGEDKSDPGKTRYMLKKLAEADSFIESGKLSKDMISFSIQRVIHTITEGYDSEDVNAGERSLFLYTGLLEGARFNLKILGKMYRLLGD